MTQELIARIEAATGPDRRILDRLAIQDGCWLWTGALDERGRGRVWRNGKIMIHHRAVWEILIGEIPQGALLCHHCDNPQCANPSHLYVGTDQSNVNDMMQRGRHWTMKNREMARAVGRRTGSQNNWATGTDNPKAKLTPEQVCAIRSSREKTKDLAAQYGVNRTTIQRIRAGKQWTAATPALALCAAALKARMA
jgi:DNA-binding XRE family transcriptional regulator